MRILLTGGGGFIGRNLNEHLSREHEVLAPSHSQLDLSDDAPDGPQQLAREQPARLGRAGSGR